MKIRYKNKKKKTEKKTNKQATNVKLVFNKIYNKDVIREASSVGTFRSNFFSFKLEGDGKFTN